MIYSGSSIVVHDKKQWDYFKALLSVSEGNKERQIELVNRLECVPEEHTIEAAERLLKITKNNEVKTLWKVRLMQLFHLLKIAKDNEVKKAVVDRLRYLPEKTIVPVTEKLLVGADNEVKIAIVNRLDYLPKETRVPVVEKLLVDADNEVKTAVANELDHLPEEARGQIRALLY